GRPGRGRLRRRAGRASPGAAAGRPTGGTAGTGRRTGPPPAVRAGKPPPSPASASAAEYDTRRPGRGARAGPGLSRRAAACTVSVPPGSPAGCQPRRRLTDHHSYQVAVIRYHATPPPRPSPTRGEGDRRDSPQPRITLHTHDLREKNPGVR